MRVKPNHPRTELLAKLLFGIEVVNAPERRRMANRACREATKWHEEEVKRIRQEMKETKEKNNEDSIS